MDNEHGLMCRRIGAPLVAIGLLFSCMTAATHAITISYGDFPGNTVIYLDVRESPSDPLTAVYGAPDPVPILADTLGFRPLDFEAISAGGIPGAVISDGQLITTVMTLPGTSGITSIHFRESGDYGMDGLTSEHLAKVSATLLVELKVFEVDNVPLLVPEFFTADDGVAFMRPPDDADGWNIEFDFDIVDLLATRGITSGRATKIDITLDNILVAMTENGSSASISKKTFLIRTVTAIPEPSTAALIVLGAFCFGLIRRRRSR